MGTTDEAFAALLTRLSHDEKIIVLSALERHLSEQGKAVSPAR